MRTDPIETPEPGLGQVLTAAMAMCAVLFVLLFATVLPTGDGRHHVVPSAPVARHAIIATSGWNLSSTESTQARYAVLTRSARMRHDVSRAPAPRHGRPGTRPPG